MTTGTAPTFDILDAWSFGAYLQDDFKITPRVTLSLGVRQGHAGNHRLLRRRASVEEERHDTPR